MDIGNIKHTDVKLDIKHPATGEPLGISVTVMSVMDPRIKNVRHEFANEELQRQKRNKADKATEQERRGRKFAWKAMTGWEWSEGTTFHGEVPEFTEKKVYEVFEELPWFAQQIDAFISEDANFLLS